MGIFEEKKNEFYRKGAVDRVKWMEGLKKTILPSQLKKIQQNDKTILQEIVLPKWASWELIYDWAQSRNTDKGPRCIFCYEQHENGATYMRLTHVRGYQGRKPSFEQWKNELAPASEGPAPAPVSKPF